MRLLSSSLASLWELMTISLALWTTRTTYKKREGHNKKQKNIYKYEEVIAMVTEIKRYSWNLPGQGPFLG